MAKGNRGGKRGSGASEGMTIKKTLTNRDLNNLPDAQRNQLQTLSNNMASNENINNVQWAVIPGDNMVYAAYDLNIDGQKRVSVIGIDKTGDVDLDPGVPDFRKKTKAQLQKEKAQKEATDNLLNLEYARNKISVKASKMDRIAGRVAKRNRRK